MTKLQTTANPSSSPAIGNINAAMQTLKAAQQELKTKIAGLDTQLYQISKQCGELANMPVSFDDWSHYLRQWVDAKGQAWMDARQVLHMCRDTKDKKAMNGCSWTELEESCQHEFFMDDRDPFDKGSAMDAMCFFMPEVVHSKLLEGLREKVGKRWGNDALPTVEERKTLVAELDEKKAELAQTRRVFNDELSQLMRLFTGGPDSSASVESAVPTAAALPVDWPLKGQRMRNTGLTAQE